jgi:hypothetical protein
MARGVFDVAGAGAGIDISAVVKDLVRGVVGAVVVAIIGANRNAMMTR